MNYVFVGAHPDDPDLLFGGTALKLVRMGHKVLFVALCNGDAGHYAGTREALAARRFGESRAAAAFLGLAGYEVFDTHDGCVRADLPTRERLVRLLRRFAPDVVVSHWLHDYHADHRATAQVVQDEAGAPSATPRRSNRRPTGARSLPTPSVSFSRDAPAHEDERRRVDAHAAEGCVAGRPAPYRIRIRVPAGYFTSRISISRTLK